MSDPPLSGKALASGAPLLYGQAPASGPTDPNEPAHAPNSRTQVDPPAASAEPLTLFITWTTYGSWLPGDCRGWRKWRTGHKQPQPLLEDWCRERMKEPSVVLQVPHRVAVERICHEHANIRGGALHAIAVRSNHVHIAVSASGDPSKVRDQFKANATRVLREVSDPIKNEKVWTRGGDIEILDTEEELHQVVLYITEAQDRKDRTE
jgi:REP element-mobilizing transposase RayT